MLKHYVTYTFHRYNQLSRLEKHRVVQPITIYLVKREILASRTRSTER